MRCIFRRGKTTNTDPQCCFMCFAVAWRWRMNGACKWGVQRWRLLYKTHRSASQLLDIWGKFRPLGSPDVGPAGPKLNLYVKSSSFNSGKDSWISARCSHDGEWISALSCLTLGSTPSDCAGDQAAILTLTSSSLMCEALDPPRSVSSSRPMLFQHGGAPKWLPSGTASDLIPAMHNIVSVSWMCVYPSSSPPSVARHDDWLSCNGSPAGALNPSRSVLFQCGLIQNVSPSSSSSSSNYPPPLPRSRVEVSCGGEGADSGRRVQAGLPRRVWNGDACQLCKARLSPRISLTKQNNIFFFKTALRAECRGRPSSAHLVLFSLRVQSDEVLFEKQISSLRIDSPSTGGR